MQSINESWTNNVSDKKLLSFRFIFGQVIKTFVELFWFYPKQIAIGWCECVWRFRSPSHSPLANVGRIRKSALTFVAYPRTHSLSSTYSWILREVNRIGLNALSAQHFDVSTVTYARTQSHCVCMFCLPIKIIPAAAIHDRWCACARVRRHDYFAAATLSE